MADVNKNDAVLTLAEVAARLRVSERTARRLAHRKELPAKKVGRAWRVARVDLDTWLAQHE